MSRLARVLAAARTRAGGSAWALLAQGAVLVGGLANFLLLARIVGPADYGVVAGSLALVLALGPLAALGADKLVVRDIAQGEAPAAAALTTALTTVLVGAVVTSAALLVLTPLVLPGVPVELLLWLAVAELVAGGAVSCCSGSRWGARDARAGGLTTTLVSVAKLVAVTVFAFGGSRDPLVWAELYALASVLASAVAVVWAYAAAGRPRLVGYRFLARARAGLPFSVNVSATIAQNDLDKTLLVRAGYDEQAGYYSVAYRLTTMAWLPVLAVLQANFARFFEVGGRGGLPATAALARRLLKPLVAYAAVAGLALVVLAPAVPWALGEEYRPSVVLVVLLAPLALFKVVQYVPSDALTGAGQQGTRTACICASLTVNLTLNLFLIPEYGLAAALVATLAAEVVYAVLVNVAVRRGSGRTVGSS